MRQEDAKCIEDNCGAMFARSLCLNKIAEFIQLEIRGKNAAHTPSQRRAQGDHRRADTERSIWWRNERAVSLLRIAVPASFSGVVAIIPQIELLDFIAVLVLEDAPHR